MNEQKLPTAKSKSNPRRRSGKKQRPSADPVRPNSSNLDTQFLDVGKILTAQGLQGEVRIYPNSDFPERFLEPGTRWLLRSGESTPQQVQLTRGRYLDGKGLYVVQFEEITDRSQAEALRGAVFLVLGSDRPALEEGEFHVLDLIGLPVFDQVTQTLVGTVTQILTAGHDLLEVELPVEENPDGQPNAAAKVLIPFVEAIVPVVDLAQRRIEITPPAGLIDLGS